MSEYDRSFYARTSPGSVASGLTVLAPVFELVRPRSVVDLGCGTGPWLAAAMQLGVDDVLGVDGPWVPRDDLLIPEDRFIGADVVTAPDLGRTFDLAISVEVAEHLPPEAADGFVEQLTRLAPVIVFSAAVPGQGGTHHVNEQWPDYWWERFRARGYDGYDLLRDRLWESDDLDWWYAQNVLVYVDRERGGELPAELAGARLDRPPRAIVQSQLVEYLRAERDYHQEHVELGRVALEAARADAAGWRADAEAARAEAVAARAEVAHLQGVMASITSSPSWQLTRPLRAAKRAVGRRRSAR